jgi:hypothetical protein
VSPRKAHESTWAHIGTDEKVRRLPQSWPAQLATVSLSLGTASTPVGTLVTFSSVRELPSTIVLSFGAGTMAAAALFLLLSLSVTFRRSSLEAKYFRLRRWLPSLD